jgi:hypothetical protein
MASHNESEWFAGDLRTDGRNPGVDITAADGAHICLVHHELGGSFAETLANARLIVACQKMLAALQADERWDADFFKHGLIGANHDLRRKAGMLRLDAIEAATGVRP